MTEGTLLPWLAGTWAGVMGRAAGEGSIALALAWGFARLFPRAPADVRCWVWRLAYLKLLLVALWPGRIELPVLPAAPSPPVLAPAAHVVPLTVQPLPPEKGPPRITAVPTVMPVTLAAPRSGSVLPGAVWLLGVLVGVARLARRRRETRRLRDGCAPVRNAMLRSEVAQLSRQLGLRAAPELLAGEVRTPLLIGCGRPAVVLPVDETMGTAERSWVLAHELAHVRRHDLLWGWLPALARLLFFFHPLVLLTQREWHFAHETACDALAIQATQAPPADYAEMLLALATRHPAARLEGTAGVLGPRHTLERRLMMLQYLRPRSRRQAAAAAALLITTGLIGLVPWRASARSEPAAAETQSRLAEKWEDLLLMEAMHYLRLTPGQLRALQPLATGADERLTRMRGQEERTTQALARIAQKQIAALVSGKAVSLQEQADALLMERTRRGRKEQTLEEIAAYVAPRLSRLLTRDQVQRAYLLANGKMPESVPRRPALLDPESGFVLEEGAQEKARSRAIRQVLSRRYPPALVEAAEAASHPRVFFLPTTGAKPSGEGEPAGTLSIAIDLKPSNDTPDADDEADRYPAALRQAARRDREALESRWSEMPKLLLEGATDEEILGALRPLARRMFGSPRLKPVLTEMLQRGGQLQSE